jgi:hypothetical protein
VEAVLLREIKHLQAEVEDRDRTIMTLRRSVAQADAARRAAEVARDVAIKLLAKSG